MQDKETVIVGRLDGEGNKELESCIDPCVIFECKRYKGDGMGYDLRLRHVIDISRVCVFFSLLSQQNKFLSACWLPVQLAFNS